MNWETLKRFDDEQTLKNFVCLVGGKNQIEAKGITLNQASRSVIELTEALLGREIRLEDISKLSEFATEAREILTAEEQERILAKLK